MNAYMLPNVTMSGTSYSTFQRRRLEKVWHGLLGSEGTVKLDVPLVVM